MASEAVKSVQFWRRTLRARRRRYAYTKARYLVTPGGKTRKVLRERLAFLRDSIDDARRQLVAADRRLAEKRGARRARRAQQRVAAVFAKGVTTFDGVPCARWIAKELARIRAAGRWKGRLVSGWRSPSYSRSLCMRMCGAPRCPGRCAGEVSNHAGNEYPRGAADVSDQETFERECERLKSPLKNRLDARDPVHFSVSGV